MAIRDATQFDFPRILELNLASESVLSPLDRAKLERLDRDSAYHRVFEQDGAVLGFLLAFTEGADYESLNYQWFATRYPSFVYIDRVVVAQEARGRGVGRQLYEDLFEFARCNGYHEVACEFDIEPPNDTSAAFHGALGFAEVGRQNIGDKKIVSLQVAKIQPR